MLFKVLLIVGSVFGAAALLDAEIGPAHVPTLQNGDWNGDFERDISDVVGMSQWLFMSGAPAVPAECQDLPGTSSAPTFQNGDVNGDEGIDVSDIVFLAWYLYLGGVAPVEIECVEVVLPPGGE